MKKFLISILFILLTNNVLSAPSPSEYLTLHQPDGISFKAEKFNDEFREYLRTNYGDIILNKNDNIYYYGECNNEGILNITSYKVGYNEEFIKDKLHIISKKMMKY